MTVMIDSFFGVHPYIIRSGLYKRMRPGERDFYLFLMEESERRCTREIAATDAQVEALVGTAGRTLCNARKKLREHGLVQYRRGQGNKYNYVICNPKTRLPYPGDPRTPMLIPKRSHSRNQEPESESPWPKPSSRATSTLSASKSTKGTETLLHSHGFPGVFQ